VAARIDRLTEKIKVKDFKLKSLLDLTHSINNNLSVDELLAQYEELLKERLKIEKLVLYHHDDEQWKNMLQFGIEVEVPPIEDEKVFESKNLSLQVSNTGSQLAFDVVIPVHHDDKVIAYVLVGDIGEQTIGLSPVIKHMNFIQTITNVMLVAVRNKKLMAENIKQEKIRQELELAAEMQAILVPNSLPSTEAFEVAAVYMPHQQVGGDYYDFMHLNDDEFMFCVADVSGKGVSAAFLMSNFQAHLRAIFSYLQLPLEDVIHELNSKVMRSAMGEKYITFFVATYNMQTRKLSYINCGHNPPVLVQGDHARLLSDGSIGLGMFEEIPSISKGQITLQKDATIVCYTDGLVEFENKDNEEYGVDRLIQLIQEHPEMSMDQLNALIMNQVTVFKGDMPWIDDTALLSCRIR
jgi:sigma-B regulation protein RsbU (phosphoserine phosphatase)